MNLLRMRSMGIKGRIVLATIIPVALMFLAIVVYSSYSRMHEVNQEMEERGQIIAASLAESSEYAVISGYMSALNGTIKGLLQVDKNVACVEIMNHERTTLLQVPGHECDNQELLTYEAPIKRELLMINPFDEKGGAHDLSSEKDLRAVLKADTIGFVRVSVTPQYIEAKQAKRIAFESLIAAIALLGTTLLGSYIALRINAPLVATIAALREIGDGHYAIKLKVTDGGELGVLQSSVIQVADSLNKYKNDMEGQVLERTRELQIARDAAIAADGEKRRLIQKVNSAVEEERKSIAADIHDHLNASLIVIKLESQRIHDIASKCGCPAAADIKSISSSAVRHVSELYSMARDIVKRLRPEVIDTLGLRDAIEEMVLQYDALHSGCRFTFHAADDFLDINGDFAITAYRLIQEALSNVVKHSNATHASVELSHSEGGRVFEIRIRDNGIGFDHAKIQRGFGLLGMRERVYGLKGALDIYSLHREGTCILIQLPYPPNNSAVSSI